MSMSQRTNATVLEGWGYLDVTHYPYGGCFRRAKEDTPVILLETLEGRHETKVRFPDGSIGIVPGRRAGAAA